MNSRKELEKNGKEYCTRKLTEFDATGVGYVNQRNKRFNEKIRQNLERGTAL
jgi:hypothetical protein